MSSVFKIEKKSESTEDEIDLVSSESDNSVINKDDLIIKDNDESSDNLTDGSFEYLTDEDGEDFDSESEYSDDDSLDEFLNLSLDDEELEYFNNFDTESITDKELKVILKFGYLVKIDGLEEVRLTVEEGDEVIDNGLIAGLTQFEELVDAHFVGNLNREDDLKFDEKFINTNLDKYSYDQVSIEIKENKAILVVKESNKEILQLDEEAFEIFVSVLQEEEETCIISVINSKISACYISDGEVVWVTPFDIGKNKYNEEDNTILTKKKKIIDLDDCYIRLCEKKIYLHFDDEDPERTIILGKTDNPFYLENLEKNQLKEESVDIINGS